MKILNAARLGIGAVVVVIIFCVAMTMAPIVLGLALLAGALRYASRIVRGMDRFGAVLVAPLAGTQWDGSHTISAECGAEVVAGTPCRFCAILCRVIDIFQTNHCRQSAP